MHNHRLTFYFKDTKWPTDKYWVTLFRSFLVSFDQWTKVSSDLVFNKLKQFVFIIDTVIANRPYALPSSSHHLKGKTVTKQSRRTDLYARRTVLANEQSPFDLWVWAPYWNDVMCIRSIEYHCYISCFQTIVHKIDRWKPAHK